MSRQTDLSHPPQRSMRIGWPRLPRPRAIISLTVAFITLLSATVALGQASENFDLACRSLITASSGTITGGNFGVTAALGLPIVPPQDSDTAPTYAIRSTDYGVRAGFLPGYPTAQTSTATNTPAQTYVQHLPLLYKVVYIIRGGC